jgi:chloride channel protein, CIC family
VQESKRQTLSDAPSADAPGLLAVAIATAISRGLSYGTIYTTKLLRRGTDIDRDAPWRAVQDLKIADVMHPFRPSLPVPSGSSALADGATDRDKAAGKDGAAGEQDGMAVSGPVASRREARALLAAGR